MDDIDPTKIIFENEIKEDEEGGVWIKLNAFSKLKDMAKKLLGD